MLEPLVTSPAVRRLARQGEAVKICPGVFVSQSAWQSASSWDRYDFAIRQVGRTRVLAGRAAARLLGLPVSPGPEVIEIAVRTRGRAGRIRLPGCPFDLHALEYTGEIIESEGLNLTPPAETILRAAARSAFGSGLGLLDAALRNASGPVSLPSLVELIAAEAELPWRGGRPSLRAMLTLATPLSGSIGESISRAIMYEHGFRMPVLQEQLILPNGATAFADFLWPDERIIGEFDDSIKYGRLLARGQTTESALVRERERELRLLELGYSVTRWKWESARQPLQLVRQLEQAGVPRVCLRRPLELTPAQLHGR